jgi:hypothetical protein
MVIATLSVVEVLRRRWSTRVYAGYLAMVAAGFLIHLAAPVFLLVAVGASAVVRLLYRSTTLKQEALLVLPGAFVIAMNAAWNHGVHTQYVYDWYSLSEKLHDWSYELGRFGGRISFLLIGMLALCVLLGCWPALRAGRVTAPPVIENLVIAVAFIALYVLLPRDYPDAAYVDIRALVMITLFLLIASAWLSHKEGGRGYGSVAVTALAFITAATNLGWIAFRMKPLEQWLSDYRQVVAAIPLHSRVLPVATLGKVGLVNPFLHAASYVVLDRDALTPYLFSGNAGDPMKFFIYRHPPYMPDESWYFYEQKWRAAEPAAYTLSGERYTWRFQFSQRNHDWEPAVMAPVDWPRIACEYEWLLVSKPFDEQFIETPVHLQVQNKSAALFAVDKASCHPSAREGLVKLRTQH